MYHNYLFPVVRVALFKSICLPQIGIFTPPTMKQTLTNSEYISKLQLAVTSTHTPEPERICAFF